MMTLVSGEIKKFEGFSLFTNLKEFNSHIEMWLAVHKDAFTKGELVGLKRLVRFSAKIPGVSNAKIGTILNAIHQEYSENGISRSTFKRMIGKALEIGIFTVHETVRQKNGSQTSNLYVFNRFPSNEPPEQEIMNQPIETNNLLKTEKDQKIKKRIEEPSSSNPAIQRIETKNSLQNQELDHTFVSKRVPQEFAQLVKCFFPEARTIEEYWHRVEIAAYRNNSENRTEMVLEAAIESFKQLIRMLKFTNAVKNRFAYFYGIVDKIICNRYYQAIDEEYLNSEEGQEAQSIRHPLLDDYDETNELESSFLMMRVLKRKDLAS